MKKLILLTFLSAALIMPNIALGARTLKATPEKLQELGAKMIDKRIAAITKYDGFLNQTKHISQPVLDTVQGELSRVSGELGSLKTKIQSETDIETLKTLVRSIVTDYYVYRVFLPQSAGIVSVDRMRAYEAKLIELNSKISAKADQLEEQGMDVSEIRNLISTADGYLTTGKGYISTAESKFTSMSISDPEGAKTLKLDGRSALLDARKSFSEARGNMRQAVQKIKKLLKPSI
jgi:hypothetical protein